MKGIISGLPDEGRPLPEESAEDHTQRAAAIAFLRKSLVDGANATPEQIVAADRDVEELKQNLNANRRTTDERLVFPE
jgi:hypothetical protein